MTSLNPVLRIARQLIEAMLVHGRYTARTARERAVDLLGRMGITTPERAIDAYPHQFSGGMRQRVMLAMGFANEPLAADRRRADDRARRHHPGPDPRPAARAQRRFRRRDRADQPRPRRDRQRLHARRRDVRAARSSRRARPSRPAERAPSPLYLGAAQRRATDRSQHSGPEAPDHDRGHAARSAWPIRRAAALRRAARSASRSATSIPSCCRPARAAARAAG